MCHKICISSYRHHDELYTYFQKVVSVMMKEVDEVDGGVTVIEYFKKMLKTTWKDQQYVDRIMQSLVKKTTLLKLADRLLNIEWKHCDVLEVQLRMN